MKPPTSSSADAVISVAALSRRFGSRQVLDDVTLHVPRGCVFGLVGENGAGKTTLIKHILGLLRAETGAVRVFGMDPVADPVEVLSRTGYLSEYRELPAWMRVDELLNYTRAFYRTWDAAYAEELRERFGLDPSARVKHLSQGQQAKAALLLALAFRPELLLLDEPSSGLDPVVRRDILEAIIRTVAEEGRTVFFSSHLLDEVERVSDQLAMIREGKIVLSGRLDDIKQSHRRLTLRFKAALEAPPELAGALSVGGAGREWSLLCNGDRDQITAAVERLGAEVVTDQAPSLEEIFLARAAGRSKSIRETAEI
jgi:ABC-2 type transport system ATP-binding protein